MKTIKRFNSIHAIACEINPTPALPLKRQGVKSRQQGFSLLEVIVALAIVAVSLGAVIHAVGVSANHEAIMGERTFARWVAMNQLAKIKIEHTWPSIGTSKGDEEMAGGNWVWKQKTLSTNDENVRRVEVSVWRRGHEKDNPDAAIVGFVAK